MTEKKEDKAVFALEQIFPDASGIFTPSYKKLNDSFQESLIVLDTNVLLLPYSMSNESLTRLKDLYSDLIKNERLFIPNRVAREFASNRNRKLCDIHNSVLSQNKGKAKNELKYPILESLEEKKEVDQAYQKLVDAQVEFYAAINKLASTISSWEWGDPVSSIYSELFHDNIFIDHKLDDKTLVDELNRRFELKIPPGYKDSKKDDSGVGDLAIWLSLVELGSRKSKDIIFVTEDVKSDWWNKSNGSEFLPRFELIDEFRRESKGGTLHIIRLSKLLELFSVQKDVIQEAKEAEEYSKKKLLAYLREKSLLRKEHYRNLTESEAVKEMKDWFYSRFQNPANCCPYDSSEGGYQYVWGGPYDAEEELFSEFSGDIDEKYIMKAVNEIEEDCTEWTGYPNRSNPNDIYF
ncbi:DUF4935 domain-containing protein [Vibrio parahaemolyticus]|nr:DUF4935 domain-containing protein [Vibrio parahaemolyticus]EJM7154292.1 DUF4935 domain-containing protein [Vibrio parahaemolyticus]HAS6746069.1 hypothetical protein [Vibrio parahaemolyticus]HAS6986397.1 hypothetical protein [Vibrio parahaemolyticus]HCG7064452.1 DUF4935 domain-containing protein [Vibrio parahaemolyticus]